MGACSFETQARGKTAQDAFESAVQQAQWEHGHGGYTGTIAEKYSFEMAQGKPKNMDAAEYVSFLTEARPQYQGRTLTPAQRTDYKVFYDKWGPALCIPIKPGVWLFAGNASS